MEQIKLLDKEQIVSIFCAQNGFVNEFVPTNSNLVLTDMRILLITKQNELSCVQSAPLDQISGISIESAEKNAKQLYQGISFFLLGIFAFVLLGSITSGALPALLLGSAICLFGTLFIWQYISWIPLGEIKFLINGYPLTFRYTSQQAREQSVTLLNDLSQTFSNYRSSIVKNPGLSD